ncbi:MAG: oligosaccharide flippase family protein [Bacteroidales bacterium]
MSFKKDFIKNVARFGGYTYMVQVLEFVSTIILSRIISPQEYGFVALILVFSGFIGVFNHIGIAHAIIRSDYSDEKIRHFFSLSIWIGMFLFVCFSLLAYPIALFYNNMKLLAPTMFLGVVFISQSLSFVPASLAKKELKFNLIGSANIIQTVFLLVFTIILAFLGFSYWSLIIPMAFSPLVRYFYFVNKVKFKPAFYGPGAALRLLKEIKSLAGSITVSGILNYWNRNTDNLVIGKFFGEISLGLYNRAYKFIYLVNRLIVGIFGVVLYPSLKKLKDTGGDTNSEFLTIVGAISLLTYPISFILILFGEPMVLILWGPDWIGVAQYLPYIGVLIMIQPILSSMTDYYVLQGKEKTVMHIAVISSILTISAIITGAFFSVVHVILFYAIANIVLLIPKMILGFYYALNYRVAEILNFWLPKIILTSFLLYFIHSGMDLYKTVVIGIYPLHLLHSQRNDMNKIIKMFKKRLTRG